MVEEFCYPITRKSLGDYYEMAWRCAKCAFCRNVLPSDTESERFGAQCPPGTRFKFEAYFASGRNELARRMIAGQQGFTERFRHILYTCTTCGACEEWCAALTGLHPLKIIMATREHFANDGGEILKEHQKVIDGIKKNHNRLNRNNRDRLGWLGDVPRVDPKNADVIYYVGCRSSFKRIEIVKSTYSLLNKLGAKVAFLEDERCCGRPLIDMGKEALAVTLLKHNVAQINDAGNKPVLFSCAECFHNFSIVEKYGIKKQFETVHLSQYLAPLLKDKNLALPSGKKVVYQDPCYLSRHQGIYDAPRDILSAIDSAELVELPRNRKNAWCCGSGGGVQEAYPEYSQWIAHERFEEVKFVGADLLVTACPGCKNNMWGVSQANGVEIADLSELIDSLI